MDISSALSMSSLPDILYIAAQMLPVHSLGRALKRITGYRTVKRQHSRSMAPSLGGSYSIRAMGITTLAYP